MRKVKWMKFPLFVKWYITARCNLRCTHCYLTDYSKQSDLKSILKYVDYLGSKGVYQMNLLGGEPLVREDLELIIQKIKTYKMDLTIATNGLLATPERAKSLVASGAKKYQVSLEGHTSKLNDPVRGYQTFERAVEGIRNLKREGANVNLSFTISKKNYKSVKEMHALAKDLGVNVLRFTAFAPVGTGLTNQEDLSLTRDISLEVRKEVFECFQNYPKLMIDTPFIGPSTDECGTCSPTFGCGAGTSTLIINQDLTLSACDLLTEQDRTKVSIDSPQDIERVWKEDPLFNKWRGIDEKKDHKLGSFEEVHQHGCHVNYMAYKENIFR